MMRRPFRGNVMRQIPTIARNAFMELVRQPVFLVLFTLSALICLGLASVPYFGFGFSDRPNEEYDLKLVENGALSVMLLSGLFAAVICASTSVAEEIRTGTALAVLSKPVSRVQFIVGKYLGLAGALGVVTYANLVAILLASRGAFDAYGRPDSFGTLLFVVFIGLGYLVAGFLNYFLNKQFVPWAVFLTLGFMTAAFLVISCMDKETTAEWWNPQAQRHAHFSDIWIFSPNAGYNVFDYRDELARAEALADKTGGKVEVDESKFIIKAEGVYAKAAFAEGVDWGLLQASFLILFMLWVLAAVALLCSTRLGMMPTLAVCLGLFVLGLMSDYFFGRPALGGAFLASGDSLRWQSAQKDKGEFAAFRLEPRGVRSLPMDSVSVRIIVGDGEAKQSRLENGGLVLGGTRLADTGTVEITGFNATNKEPHEIFFGTLRDELAPHYIAWLLREELGRHTDAQSFIRALRMRGVEMEEGIFMDIQEDGQAADGERFRNVKAGSVTPEELAREIAANHRLTDIFPGNLSFWVYPEGEGTLSIKAAQGGGSSGAGEMVEPGAWWAKMLYVFIPNWQLFWLADALGPGKTIPWGYVGRSFLYVLSYLGLALMAAFYLFEDRELS
tara:strand:+ start:7067 stop:8914 length:1848 start_codon:yes stop_codon:yes gene_type:complete